MTPAEIGRAERDEPLLKSLVGMALIIRETFQLHHLDPPASINLPYETGMRLKMMNRDQTFVTHDYKAIGEPGYCATICGIKFFME